MRAQSGGGSVPSNNYSTTTTNFSVQNYVGSVTAEKMNVMYVGVDNYIAVSVPGLSDDKIQISGSGSNIILRKNTILGSGHYIANVENVGICMISVEANVSGKLVSIGTYKFRVKRVPDPVSTISNSKGGMIDKDRLASASLIPQLENFDFELFFKIIGFKITIIKNEQTPLELEILGNQLPQFIRDELLKTQTGDIVIFQNIKAIITTEENSSPRILQPLVFTIK